jgi:hypothetical protein
MNLDGPVNFWGCEKHVVYFTTPYAAAQHQWRFHDPDQPFHWIINRDQWQEVDLKKLKPITRQRPRPKER